MTEDDQSALARMFPAAIRKLYEHAFVRRLFWFMVGGVLSVACNTQLFHAIESHFQLPKWAAYAVSLAVMTIFTFSWSYFVNFRTDKSWHLCAGKYVATLGVCYVINYFLAQAGFSAVRTMHFATEKLQEDAVIAAAQIFTAFIKFGIFHYWVFPARAAVEPSS